MKNRFLLFTALLILCTGLSAKENTPTGRSSKPLISYRTVVYTDSTLSADLTNEASIADDASRGFGSGLLNALGNAALGVATG